MNPPPPAEPAAPVAPVPQVLEAPHGIVIRNRRYITVLAVSTYRLCDQTQSLRQDQMKSLSATAALLRPRLQGYMFSGSPPLAVLPFFELKAVFCQGLRDPVFAHFAATQAAAEFLDTVPRNVLVSRAERLESGNTSHVFRPTTSGTRLPASRLALTISSE
jgi:hypothetical protein